MKIKTLILLLIPFALTSCFTVKESAYTQRPVSYVNTATIADLEVSPKKITFTLEPSRDVQRGGTNNVIQTAINEALKMYGGDVLVNMTYTIEKYNGLIFHYIEKITVTGYPATYKNFRCLDDSIWEKTPLDGIVPLNRSRDAFIPQY